MSEKMRISIIILMFFSCSLYAQKWSYHYVDSLSYKLYQQKEWQELNKVCREARHNKVDYYWLRMRSAIGYMERQKYMKAIRDLKKAKYFNSYEQLPGTLSIISYLNTGRYREALELNKKDSSGLRFLNFSLESGPLFPGKHKVEDDLDGEPDVYGEHLRLNGAMYTGANTSILINKLFKLSLQYSIMSFKGEHLISYNNTADNNKYSLTQAQLYVSSSMYMGKGIFIDPYFNLLKSNYTNYTSEYDSLSYSYNPVDQTFSEIEYFYSSDSNKAKISEYVAGMSFEKRWSQLYLGMELSLNNVNQNEYYQTGVNLTWYLTGSFEYYVYAALFAQYISNDLKLHQVYKTGFQPFENFWVEAGTELGQFKGFNINKGSLLYNMPDDIQWKGDLCFKYLMRDRFELSLRYVYMRKHQEYIQYTLQGYNQNNFPVFEESLYPDNYNQHLFIFGLNIIL